MRKKARVEMKVEMRAEMRVEMSQFRVTDCLPGPNLEHFYPDISDDGQTEGREITTLKRKLTHHICKIIYR